MGFDLNPTETTWLVRSPQGDLLINVAFFHLFSKTPMWRWKARIHFPRNPSFQPLGSVLSWFGLLGHLCFSTPWDRLDRLALGSQLFLFHRQLGNVAVFPQKPQSRVCCSAGLNTSPEFRGRGGRADACVLSHVTALALANPAPALGTRGAHGLA